MKVQSLYWYNSCQLTRPLVNSASQYYNIYYLKQLSCSHNYRNQPFSFKKSGDVNAARKISNPLSTILPGSAHLYWRSPTVSINSLGCVVHAWLQLMLKCLAASLYFDKCALLKVVLHPIMQHCLTMLKKPTKTKPIGENQWISMPARPIAAPHHSRHTQSRFCTQAYPATDWFRRETIL